VTTVSHQRFSVGEELSEINERIVAINGPDEYLGEETTADGSPRYLFASSMPMIGHLEALAYMRNKLRDAEKASLEQD
jgi:hypothetical protein